MKKTALIVDDERLARNELKKMLQEYPEIEVVGEAVNAEDAKKMIDEHLKLGSLVCHGYFGIGRLVDWVLVGSTRYAAVAFTDSPAEAPQLFSRKNLTEVVNFLCEICYRRRLFYGESME